METSELQQLQREVQELRSEVRHMRRILEAFVTVAALGIVVLFPTLAGVAVGIGALVLFGFVVSPYRRLIFESLSRRRN